MTGAAAKLIFIQTSPHIDLSPGLLRRTNYGARRFERLILIMMYVCAASLLPLSVLIREFCAISWQCPVYSPAYTLNIAILIIEYNPDPHEEAA